MTQNDLSYCGELVREHDPDRFLLSLFAPAQRRAALWALFAFHHEIAKTREVVSETKLGQIRLQWWREAIAAIYQGGDVPEHAVVQALGDVIRAYHLPQAEFETLLHAREFDLEDVQPGDTGGLVHYADFTTTPLTRLCLMVLGCDADLEPVQTVSVNYALVGLMRAIPFHAAQNRFMLPADLTQEHHIRLSGIYTQKYNDEVAQIVRAVLDEGFVDSKPKHTFLRAMQGLARHYHRRIKRAHHDVFHRAVQNDDPLKVLKLLVSVRLGGLF